MNFARHWSALVQRTGEVIAALALGLAPHLTSGPAWRLIGDVSNGGRVAIAALSITGVGLVGVFNREAFCGKACPDPVLGTKVPTIGFGSTEGVKMGDTITPLKAINRTLHEVQVMEGTIKRCAFGVELFPYEYDAYIELAHNIGAAAFCDSKIVKSLQAQDYAAACNHILDWKYVKNVDCSKPNKVCTGLWSDRLRIHQKCLGAGAQ
jgi:lysozyme